jgi:hypothetical protein
MIASLCIGRAVLRLSWLRPTQGRSWTVVSAATRPRLGWPVHQTGSETSPLSRIVEVRSRVRSVWMLRLVHDRTGRRTILTTETLRSRVRSVWMLRLVHDRTGRRTILTTETHPQSGIVEVRSWTQTV